jgi:hypothetical protein
MQILAEFPSGFRVAFRGHGLYDAWLEAHQARTISLTSGEWSSVLLLQGKTQGTGRPILISYLAFPPQTTDRGLHRSRLLPSGGIPFLCPPDRMPEGSLSQMLLGLLSATVGSALFGSWLRPPEAIGLEGLKLESFGADLGLLRGGSLPLPTRWALFFQMFKLSFLAPFLSSIRACLDPARGTHGGNECFGPTTLLLTPQGLRPISCIRPGDVVRGAVLTPFREAWWLVGSLWVRPATNEDRWFGFPGCCLTQDHPVAFPNEWTPSGPPPGLLFPSSLRS